MRETFLVYIILIGERKMVSRRTNIIRIHLSQRCNNPEEQILI